MEKSEIGVVIQGAVNKKLTPLVISSVRQFLPGAFIVLSTWDGTEKINDVDLQLNNKDPGANILDARTGQLNNLNRQIVSTRNGVEALRDRGFSYVLKLRSDTCLISSNFLNYWDRWEKRWDEFKVFSHRVIICSKYVRPSWLLPYHISDWAFFGATEDLIKLFEIDLEPDCYVNWFNDHHLKPAHSYHLFRHFRHRYCAEQYIWYSCLAKYYDLTFEDMFDTSNGNIGKSTSSIVNNFTVLDDVTFGVKYLKFKTGDEFCFTEKDWIEFYNRKTLSNEVVPVKGSRLLAAEKRLAKNQFKTALNKLPRFVGVRDTIRYGFKYAYNSVLRHFLSGTFSGVAEQRYFCGLCYRTTQTTGRYHHIKGILKERIVERDAWDVFSDGLDDSIDRIVCLETATGETTLIASNLQLFFNSAATTAFVFTRKSAKVIFDLISGHKYQTYLAEDFNLTTSDSECFERLVSGKLVTKYFPYTFWNTLWNSKFTFTNVLSEQFGINATEINLFNFDESKLEQVRNKLNTYGLTPGKFVVIAPEAVSIQKLPRSFWDKKIKTIRQSGLKVFVNSVDGDISFKNSVSYPVSMEELIYIIKCSAHFYSIRSGLCEFAAVAGVPMDIYYPLVNKKWPNLKHFYENYRFCQYVTQSVVKEHIVRGGGGYGKN